MRLLNGRRHDIILGAYGSPESRAEYRRILAELEVHGGRYPLKQDGTVAVGLTVNELCLRFWQHAEKHYRLADGSPSGELDNHKYAQVALSDLYGKTLASEFGPLKLKAVRQRMIDTCRYLVRFTEGDRTWERWVTEKRFRQDAVLEDRGEALWKKKWLPVQVFSRRKAVSGKVINQRIDYIKRMFKWAVSEELVLPSVHEALRTVAGLRRGHPGTFERPKVKPVPPQHVEAVLPVLCSQVAAMVRLQQLMGARPTEVCLMRGRHLDRSGPVWWYKIDPNDITPEGPADSHKTAHHETPDGSATVKILPIGPKAQAILKEWLRENPDEYLFQPSEARKKQYEERREARKTPLWRSHVAHQARKRKTKPKRKPRDHYDHHSYARAIARACQKAGVPHWHPHQLKHVCGTEVRTRFGVEASMIYLGHSKLSTTEIYAEKNMALVEQIAMEMG